jgi:hypothetical protein
MSDPKIVQPPAVPPISPAVRAALDKQTPEKRQRVLDVVARK